LAGYSGTPLPKKLGIKDTSRVGIFGAPPGMRETIGPLPDGVETTTVLRGALDVAILFVTRRADLAKRFGPLAKAIAPAGGLWISWPKKSSGAPTDLDESVVRAIGPERGLVDVKVCAVDETWSGLKFVVRLEDRPKATPRRR
jgi:hypothetical protein